MISRSSDIFNRSGNDWILPKNVCLKQQVFENYARNYARYNKLKIISPGLPLGVWLLWEYQNKILICH